MKAINKKEQQIENDIKELKQLVESAEGQNDIVIAGINYPASRTWREISKLALSIANQQEWFECHES